MIDKHKQWTQFDRRLYREISSTIEPYANIQEIMMATVKEQDIFASRILVLVGEETERLGEGKVTGFLLMAGEFYDRKLMVVGRAVNGCNSATLRSISGLYRGGGAGTRLMVVTGIQCRIRLSFLFLKKDETKCR